MVTLFLPLPPDVLRARNIFAVLIPAGTVAALTAILLRGSVATNASATGNPSRGMFRRIKRFVAGLADGMRDIGNSRLLPAVVGLSLLKLAVQALAFLAILDAWGFRLPVSAGFAVFLLGYLGLCIPSTPAGTGLFQLFVVAGLGFFGIDKSAAAGFSLVAFLALTLPPALAGFFALARCGLTLHQIRRQIGGPK